MPERAVECRCGKRWFPTRYRNTDMADFETRLAEMSLCQACSMDVHKAMDMCPESVPMQNGISACSLPWHHSGECVPMMTPENVEQIKELRRQRA